MTTKHKNMAHISFPFKKTNKAVFKKPTSAFTRDETYWKNLGSATLIKEYGAIDYLHFSPVEPYYFAATCSVRVQIYDPITKAVAKNISKFQQTAYGGTFRSDGRLLVAGSEDAAVKMFDVSSKNLLRVFTGHTGPVHRTYFTKDQTKILSCSDDKSSCLWDIAVEQQIASFSEHSDYIRAGAPSPIAPDLFVTGSYDNTVKVFDARTNESIVTVNHGSPVESTLFLPSGAIFISAGGTDIKVWDMFNAGKLIASISQHHKTVTSLCLGSNNNRLLSGSLDRHVKVFDVNTFKQVHSMDLPNAVLSMALSENDDYLAVGMIDGIISLRKMKETNKVRKEKKKGQFKFVPDFNAFESEKQSRHRRPPVDVVVRSAKTGQSIPETLCEKHLRKMEFKQALGIALKPYYISKTPEVTLSILQELMRRQVLHIAYLDCEERNIALLLKFFQRYIGTPLYTPIIIDAANIFIDVFGDQMDTFGVDVMRLYRMFLKFLKEEIDVCKNICQLEGAISMLLAGSQIDTDTTVELNDQILPSLKAQKEIVIDV